VEKGMPRREAYRIQQVHAHAAWDEGADFRELVSADPVVREHLPDAELAELFDYSYYIRHVDALLSRVGLGAKEHSSATA